MTTTPGAAQVAATVATLAQTTAQHNWLRRFVSPPIAAQDLTNASFAFVLAGLTSNFTNSSFNVSAVAYVWRPSSGTRIGFIADQVQLFTFPGTETGEVNSFFSSGVAALDGDVIIVEIWGNCSQAMATSYTWTYDYEGTTDPTNGTAATSAASYISISPDIPLYSPPIIVPMGVEISGGQSSLISAKPPKGKLFLPEGMMDLGSRSRLPNQYQSVGIIVPPSDTTPPTVDFTIVGR